MAMIGKEDPIFVNRPNPLMANGQMAGNTNALAIPSNEMQSTDVKPVVSNDNVVKKMPKTVVMVSAFSWEMYFGIVAIPIK